jgi:hypothetical protein
MTAIRRPSGTGTSLRYGREIEDPQTGLSTLPASGRLDPLADNTQFCNVKSPIRGFGARRLRQKTCAAPECTSQAFPTAQTAAAAAKNADRAAVTKTLDLGLFSHFQCVVDLDPKVPHSTFKFGVAK